MFQSSTSNPLIFFIYLSWLLMILHVMSITSFFLLKSFLTITSKVLSYWVFWLFICRLFSFIYIHRIFMINVKLKCKIGYINSTVMWPSDNQTDTLVRNLFSLEIVILSIRLTILIKSFFLALNSRKKAEGAFFYCPHWRPRVFFF